MPRFTRIERPAPAASYGDAAMRDRRRWLRAAFAAPLIAALCLLAWPEPPTAAAQPSVDAVLFSDDFETADLAVWSASVGGGASAVVTAQAHSGLHSFASTATAAGGAGVWYQDSPFAAAGLTHFRLYFYLPGSYTLTPGASVQIAALTNTANFDRFRIYLTNLNGVILLRADNVNGQRAVSRDAWHCLEAVHNVPAKTFSVSLNGVADISRAGIERTARNAIEIGVIGGAGNHGTIYYDDVAVSTGPLGLTGTSVQVRHANPHVRTGLKLFCTLTDWSANDQFEVQVDGNAVYKQTGRITGVMTPNVSLAGLPAGAHTLTVRLLDANGGKERAAWSGQFTKPAGGTPLVAIDADNNILLQGVKTFPIGAFLYNSPTLIEWRNAGYINYGGWVTEWAANYNPSTYEVFLKAIRPLPTFGPSLARMGGFGTDVEKVAGYAATFAQSTSVLGWNFVDEPEINGETPERMTALMNAAHARDTNHPVVLNHYGYYPRSAKPYLYPAATADIHGFDIYPVIFSSGKACEDPAPFAPGNFQQCAPQFRHYFHVMDEFRRWDYGLSPWIPIIENGNEASRGRSASPTPAQFRMEAWLNIIHGAKGLAYWPAQDWGTVPRDILPEMGALAKTTAALKDAILGDVTARTVASNRTATGSRVDAMVRQTPGYIWVFAARLTDFGEENAAPLSTQITVSDMTGTQTATVYGEDRTVQVVNGVLTDAFAPYGVHIYQIPYGPAAPKLESVQVK